MDDISVGEYVRTKRGIAKVLEVKTVQPKMYSKHDLAYLIDTCRMYITSNEILKHSTNIIDLIEVGDYVNSWKILEIANSIYKNSKRILIYRNEKESYERWIYIQEYDGKIHTQDDIANIVTHEQFASVMYEV